MNKEELHNLFQLNTAVNAPEFIIYSETISNRLQYSANFIFKNVLNCKVVLTDDIELFKSSGDYKINFTSANFENAFQIIPSNFIFEKGVNPSFSPAFELKNNSIYFFPSVSGYLSFDIFSAVFYLISRYEEWQTFTPDEHNRFELKNSILHKHQLHLKPVINYWIEELKIALQTQFKQLAFPEKEFKFISTLDVDNLYAYKNKGLTRTAGALVKDFLRFDFKNLSRRISVITGKQADPFDVYEELTDFCNQEKTTLIYFFLQRSNTKYDRTIDPNSSSFKKIFAQFKNQRVLFGLHPSYHTYNNKHLLKKELELINSNSKSNINISRQHYLRYDIKITPSLLKETGIIADFSMGFASGSGYRAGTFTPFSYYNFTAEAAQELLMVPFVAMDGAYFVYSKTEAQVAENQLTSLAAEAKKLKGVFISVFHERTFDNELYPGFKQVYFNHIIKVKQ